MCAAASCSQGPNRFDAPMPMPSIVRRLLQPATSFTATIWELAAAPRPPRPHHPLHWPTNDALTQSDGVE